MNLIITKNVPANNFEIALVLTILFCIGVIIRAFYRNKKRYNNLLLTMAHYRELLDSRQDILGLIIFKPKLHFEYINPSITALTGHPAEKLLACPELFKSLIHPDDRYLLETGPETPGPARGSQLFPFRMVKPDASFIKLEAKLISPRKPHNTHAGFYIIPHKIMVQPKFLQDISHVDRLNTISQMASSVAHEIRNPMTTVKGYLQLFSEKTEFGKYKEQFELIIDELDRADMIIKEYLALNQNKLHNPKLCKLNNIIDSLYPLLKAEANNNGKDIKIYLGNIPELLLKENEIRQLILNMVRNGLEAMSDMNDRIYVRISTYLENDKVVMSIKDQGPGIAPDILADIGQPFLSTKEQGTGLGLMVCYQIAANHNAQIQINTNHDGTDFFVNFFLPESFEQGKSA